MKRALKRGIEEHGMLPGEFGPVGIGGMGPSPFDSGDTYDEPFQQTHVASTWTEAMAILQRHLAPEETEAPKAQSAQPARPQD